MGAILCYGSMVKELHLTLHINISVIRATKAYNLTSRVGLPGPYYQLPQVFLYESQLAKFTTLRRCIRGGFDA